MPKPGDLTSIARTRAFSGTSDTAVTRRTYDVLGNVVTITDPKQNDVEVEADRKSYAVVYDDNFAAGGAAKSTYGMATRIESPAGASGDLKPVTTYQYDYYTGQVTKALETAVTEAGTGTEDRSEVRYTYSDPLDRVRTIERWEAGASAANHRTWFDYTDTPGSLALEQKSDQYGADYNHYQKTCYDDFGRPVQTIQGSATGVATAVYYDGWGRTTATSNPKNYTGTWCGPGAVGDWQLTVNTYDSIDRATGVSYPDGSAENTLYDVKTARITDAAGKTRTVEKDALGRTAPVIEAGTYTTRYTYTALDQLYGVTQGTQTRAFRYDSLGMLRSATNPESGVIQYAYDKNGNLISRKDAKGQVTCYG